MKRAIIKRHQQEEQEKRARKKSREEEVSGLEYARDGSNSGGSRPGPENRMPNQAMGKNAKGATSSHRSVRLARGPMKKPARYGKSARFG